MSRSPWLAPLRRTLSRLRRAERLPRVAVLGIGHELRGDDAAGVLAARALTPLLAGRDDVLILEGGPAPENQTGPLRRFAPDLVLLVDAAQMNESPGAVCWLPWQDTTGLSASTHTLPPYMLARYLSAGLGCEVALLGIQPAGTEIGAPLSPPVRQAIDSLVAALAGAL